MPKTVTGKFQDALGSLLVGAKVYFRLSQDAVALGTSVIVPSLVSATTDGAGTISLSMWFNDELTPTGTTYSVSVVQAGGGLVWGAENVSIAGASFDLNSAVPTNIGVTFGDPVLKNPSAVQVITGFALTALLSTPLRIGAVDVGISRTAAATLTIGNGSQGDTSGTLVAGDLRGGILHSINAAGIVALGISGDTGISRISAGVIGVGDGTSSSVSGILKASELFAGSAPGAAAAGDIGAARTATTGVLWLGSDGALALFRSAATAFSFHTATVDVSVPITANDTVTLIAATQTLTNKRVTPRITTLGSSTTFTSNSDTDDVTYMNMTGATGTLTIGAPTGTPTDGQKLILRIKATNSQTYSFNAAFRFSTTVTAPTTLAAAKTDYIGCMWIAADSKWDVVAVDQGH